MFVSKGVSFPLDLAVVLSTLKRSLTFGIQVMYFFRAWQTGFIIWVRTHTKSEYHSSVFNVSLPNISSSLVCLPRACRAGQFQFVCCVFIEVG